MLRELIIHRSCGDDFMITVQVVDEDGNSVVDMDISIETRMLNRVLEDPDHRRLCCLKFIDPYGDTVFNRAQMESFLNDLQSLRARAESENDATLVDELKRMGELVHDEVHLYLKFIGD
jgi:hypothetical protein